MDMYLPPPPPQFFPRLPPRPPPPTVPVVPGPEIPDTLSAPEGTYTRLPHFPYVGNPTPILGFDPGRPAAPSSGAFGSAAFLAAPGGFGSLAGAGPAAQPAQAGTSAGSTLVNGVWHPPHPVRFAWASVFFAAKGAGGLGNLLGMGKGEAGAGGQTGTEYDDEPDFASDSDEDVGSTPDVGTAVPQQQQQQQGKKLPFGKSSSGLPRPRTSLRSSSSQFVTRFVTMESLPKAMADKGRNGPETVRWAVFNIGKTVGWGEEGGKIKECMGRASFAHIVTTVAVNQATAAPDRLDAIVGFVTGDIVWMDFTIGRYSRINKGGILNSTAVTALHFDPSKPHHFIATFADNTILQFNLFAEDPTPAKDTAPVLPWPAKFDSQIDIDLLVVRDGTSVPGPPGRKLASKRRGTRRAAGQTGADGAQSEGEPAAGEVDELVKDRLVFWKNEEWDLANNERDKKEREKYVWAGKNPIAACRVGRKGLKAVAFSPDGKALAIVSDDGMLRIIDVQEERLADTFESYYGPLTCVSWSPDSRFIATGGQDDLVTLYSAREARVVARGQGHTGYVTCIAWDRVGRGEGRGYRFATVGEDGKLLFWDFTAASLHRPRHHHVRPAGQSTISLGLSRPHLPTAHFHPAPSRGQVARLQPVLARVIEGNMLTGVWVLSTSIVTVGRGAEVRVWVRPAKDVKDDKEAAGRGRKE
ncbi:hypothetical protein Q5752_004497 [Cryptotrichosporon argae]